jgi:hypothetical protein
MSLYREARSPSGRWIAAVVAALVVGVGIGAALGVALAPEPSLADEVGDVQEDVRPALDALELVPIHYDSSQAVTRRAAGDQLARARDTFDDAVPELRLLDPAGTAAVQRDLGELEGLLRAGGDSADVEQVARRAALRLRTVARLTRQ